MTTSISSKAPKYGGPNGQNEEKIWSFNKVRITGPFKIKYWNLHQKKNQIILNTS